MTATKMCPIYGIAIDSRLTFADPSSDSILAVSGDPSGFWANAPEILDPLEIVHECDPRNSRFGFSTLTFDLIDVGGQATTIVSTDIIGSQVRLYTKEYLDAWLASPTSLFRGVISDVRYSAGRWTVVAKSASSLMKKTFNVGATTLDAALSAGATSATLLDAEAFEDDGVFLVDSELIHYTMKTDNGSNWTLSGLTRGYLGTTDATHADAVQVTEAIVLGPDHPFEIARGILNGTYPKTTPAIPDWVNDTSIDDAITALGASYEMQFVITEPQDVAAFLEREIFGVLGAYPFEDENGLYCIKLFSDSPASVEDIDESNSLNWPEWAGQFPDQINNVTYYFDLNYGTGKYESSAIFSNAGLIELYGSRPLIIESNGLRSSLTGTATLIEDRASAIIDRFGFLTPVLRLSTLFAERFLGLGDTVTLSFDQVPDASMTDIGLESASAEIVGMRHQLKEGVMEFDILMYPPVLVALTSDEETAFAMTSTPEAS